MSSGDQSNMKSYNVSALSSTFEPRHAKTNIVTVRAAKTQIRVFAVRMKKAWVLSYPLSAQRRL